MKKKRVNRDHRITGNKEKVKMLSTNGGPGNMTYKDYKRRAIALGMPFPDACAADWGALASYIAKSDNKPDTSLIDKYDEWVDKILEERGYPKDHPMRSYQLALGFISEDEETKEKKPKRIKGLEKPKKPKREKDEIGLWKGTKKSYTFELTLKGFSLERVTRRVLKKFPDAKEKSVQQWYRAALRKNPNLVNKNG